MNSKVPYTARLNDVMSNFDHSVDADVARQLKKTEAFADYPGWNFHGRVWWDRKDEQWSCEVWTYKEPREVVSAETLEDLMREVSERYGYE